MGFGLGGVLAGVAGGVADFFSAQQMANAQRDINAANIGLSHEQMTFSADQAQKQMDFQERMSDTTVYRMARDLKSAGINPMLAAGSGEPMASGAMGSMSLPSLNPVPPVWSNMLSTAKDFVNTYATFKSSMASADAAKATAAKAGVETELGKKKLNEASLESRIFGWLNNLVDKVSGFSAKQMLPTAPWSSDDNRTLGVSSPGDREGF